MAGTFRDVEYTKINIDQPLEGALNSAYHRESSEEEDNTTTQNDRGRLLSGNKDAAETSKEPSIWSWQFYQNLFDVDTHEVLRRLLAAILPHPRVNFIRQTLRPKSDLYGPFWISTTLIFVIAIGGNITNYMGFQGRGPWVYDFRKVTLAASAIYGYWWFLPLITWGYLKWRGNQLQYNFIELLALFGYSLTIYIPASLLWMVPIAWFQWLVVAVSLLLSSSVIAVVLMPIITETGDRKSGIIIISIITILHVALAMGFMLYFFHHVPLQTPIPTNDNKMMSFSTTLTTLLPSPSNLTKISQKQ